MLLLILAAARAADGSLQADWSVDGGSGAQLGGPIGGAGDFDGDGFDDVFATDRSTVRTSSGRLRDGALRVWFGSETGLVADPDGDWVGTMATADMGTDFGASAAALGDLDGDGDADLAVGAPEGTGALDGGAVYVFRGATGTPPTRPSDVLYGFQADLGLGHDLAAGGDLDGDGLSDLLASALGYDGTSADQGAVVAWLGGATLSASPDWIGTEDAGATLAWNVVGPGDVDGDGYDDVLAGSPVVGGGGAVFLFGGGAAGPGTASVWRVDGDPRATAGEIAYLVSGAGDVNADGFADFAVTQTAPLGEDGVWVYTGSSAGPTSTPTWIAADGASFDLDGEGGIAPAGDVDLDGYDDLVVAVAHSGAGAEGVYLYPGGAFGVGDTPVWRRDGGGDSDHLGTGLGAAGDPNGDGLPDLLVGDARLGGGGAVYLFYGPLADADGDGDPSTTDCDDADADRSSLHDETCDGVDDDCDGVVDEPDAVDALPWYRDADRDGWGDPGRSQTRCTPLRGWVTIAGDCDDAAAGVYPGAPEVAGDGIDQDCDGADAADADGDGSAHPTDCDDTDATVYPGAPDPWYDGVDQDCAGDDDWDQDGDGWQVGASIEDCDDTDATVAPWDCDPTAYVVDGVTVTLSGRQSLSSLWVVNGGRLVVQPWSGSGSRGYVRILADVVFVDATSSIDASGAGYRGGRAGSAGEGGAAGGSAPGGGGGNGGAGGGACGWSYEGGAGGAAYGAADDASLNFGGGGAGHSYGSGGTGGGGVGIAAGVVWIEGAVRADGRDAPWAWDPFTGVDGGYGGGGAGGTVSIRADEVRCTGTLSADGGAPGVYESYDAWLYAYSGGGGGGRIHVHAPSRDLDGCAMSVAVEVGECGVQAGEGTITVGD